MSVLLHHRREEGEKAIKQLQERRSEIAEALNAIAFAANTITGRVVTLVEMESLLTSNPYPVKLTAACYKFWLNHTGYEQLPVKEEALATAFYPDANVGALIKAVTSYNGWSNDANRYWQDGVFVAPEVTKGERASILERAEIRVDTEQDATFYREVEKMVDLANYQNAKTQHDTVTLRDLTTGQNGVYRGLIRTVPAGPHPLDKPTLAVNLAAFNPVVSNYKAFDEA